MMVGGSVKTNREFFADLLRKKLDYGDRDVVLARATILGTSAGRRKRLVYECIDVYDEVTRMTAMMRTTAFPAAIIARMMAEGTLTARGVMPPEACVPGDLLIEQLRRRNVRITTTVTETWG
jgi:lysine 6-dehydrogenase